MADCCQDKSCALERLRGRQSSTLKTVLWINAVMFVVVLSLYAVGRGGRAKGGVSMLKGTLILGAALFVVAQIGYKILHPGVPLFDAMGIVGALALAANGACLALLWRHRHEDVNMSSVWECSRNDIAANLAVLLAAPFPPCARPPKSLR